MGRTAILLAGIVSLLPTSVGANQVFSAACGTLNAKPMYNDDEVVCVAGDVDYTCPGPGSVPLPGGHVYIIAAGTLVPGALTDVTGAPHVISSVGGAGAFWDETVWLPPLVPGEYDVVLDERCDGIYVANEDGACTGPCFTVLDTTTGTGGATGTGGGATSGGSTMGTGGDTGTATGGSSTSTGGTTSGGTTSGGSTTGTGTTTTTGATTGTTTGSSGDTTGGASAGTDPGPDSTSSSTTSSSSTGTAATDTGTGTTAGSSQDETGCGCTSQTNPFHGVMLLGLLGWVRRRRRED